MNTTNNERQHIMYKVTCGDASVFFFQSQPGMCDKAVVKRLGLCGYDVSNIVEVREV